LAPAKLFLTLVSSAAQVPESADEATFSTIAPSRRSTRCANLSRWAQRSPADRDLWLHDPEGDQLFCRRRSMRKHPFDCSSLRSEQVALTSFGPLPRDDLIRPTLSCGSGCEAHFARLGQKRASRPAYSGGRHIGSEEPLSWSGRAVRFAPLPSSLSAQGPRCTDPTIAPAFDGLKISVSRRAKFIDRSLLGSSFLGPRNEGFNRCLSPPGFRSAPQSGSYGAL
jgi:hypothetical protein